MPNWVQNNVKITMKGEQGKKLLSEVKNFVRSHGETGADGDGSFDFQSIVPMPDSYIGIDSGSETENALAIVLSAMNPNNDFVVSSVGKVNGEKWAQIVASAYSPFAFGTPQELVNNFSLCKSEVKRELMAETEEEYCEKLQPVIALGKRVVENILNYGAKDWYDWRCAHWGTKWNAACVRLVSATDECLEYSFQTAWSLPDEVFRQLSKLYPDIQIEVQYANEDIGYNCGLSVYNNGVCVDSTVGDLMKIVGQTEVEQYSAKVNRSIESVTMLFWALYVWGYDRESYLKDLEEELS